MILKKYVRRWLGVALWIVGVPWFDARAADMERDFATPPASARPGVWWRWIDGHITREGITRDLTEMARKGVAAADIFDVTGASHPGPVPMMGPVWREMFQHAVEEAARLGIELRIVTAAGWGMGAPWVDEAHATKTLRYTETQVDGPRHFEDILPRASGAGTYYRDVAVMAVREPDTCPAPPARVEASSTPLGYCNEQNWPPMNAFDRDPVTVWKSQHSPSIEKPQWIQWTYPAPINAVSLVVSGAPSGGPQALELQASPDGESFTRVAVFTMGKGDVQRIEFSPVTASVFRLSIHAAHTPDIQLAEVCLLRAGDEPRLRKGIKWWDFKSGHRAFWDWPHEGPAVLDDEYPGAGERDCRVEDVVDLTAHMDATGRLAWEVPPGRWTILRFASVLLGEPPRAMSRALTGGYEADPYSTAAARVLYDHTARILAENAGPLAGKTLTGIFIDSYEIGASVNGLQGTWTDDFREQFVRRRGYDPRPYLPAMARRVVGDRETTGRFLWDWRQTLSELYNDFYAHITQLAHQQGMHSRAENGYGSYPFPHIDGLAAFARVDVPYGEFWFRNNIVSQFYRYADSVRTAASAAHIYGRTIVAAEALTIADGRRQTPADWKTHLDGEFANGLNQVLTHLWSLQYDVKARPGLHTYDALNANLTWWEMSRPFVDYLARCQYLLQRGRPVADACYFYGEGTAKFVPGRAYIQPSLPAGYEFDGVNAEVLLTRMSTREGWLRLPDGMRYRYLVLPEKAGWTVTPPVLEKIKALIKEGATVIGPPPGRTPHLRGIGAEDARIRTLADEVWGADAAAEGSRSFGHGRVIWGRPMERILREDGLAPDCRPQGTNTVAYAHRRLENGDDIYFVANPGETPLRVTQQFRVADRQPELWHPVTGAIRPLHGWRMENACTLIPLRFEPTESYFIVFRQPARAPQAARTPSSDFPALMPAQVLNGPWRVEFDARWVYPVPSGAEGTERIEVVFDDLRDWTRRPEEGLRYYSGTAVYRQAFALAQAVRPGHDMRFWLDLGAVHSMARVRLNGRDLGVVWCPPWRVDITQAVTSSNNQLEIEVANLWVNRLVGDETRPPAERRTQTNRRNFKAGTPLMCSGLLGPVTIQVLDESKTGE